VPAQAFNQGNTAAGTNLFWGSCGDNGTTENIYSFTPGAPGEVGTLSLVLLSNTYHDIHVRTACADPSTELGCSNNHVLQVAANGGEPLYIFVDAFDSSQEGPYTLDVGFEAAICGDGNVVLPETCDDGNTSSGDGCAADCTLELDFFCATAKAAQLGANAGDTNSGTPYFKGSCTGTNGAREDILQLVPPSGGTLSLVLSSQTDQGLSVRSTCLDESTELGCADMQVAGVDETLDVMVTGGVPVFIFVEADDLSEEGPYTLTVSLTP
jgi:cysteine-rich repeat protein